MGAVAAGALVLRRRLAPPLLAGAFGLAIGVGVLGLAGNLGFALVAMAVASAGALLLEIVATTLLQRIVPDNVRGRTLGLMETASVTAYAAGSFIVPVLGAGQPTLVLAGCGIGMAVAGIVSVVLIGRYGIQEPAPIDPRIQMLAAVPLFAGLPPDRLERAMRVAKLRAMKAGDVIIRQGDEADFFYVIADGEVEVTQRAEGDGARVLRRMGPAEFFGEIGLLSGIPRTATVTAVADGQLVALDGATFLELVSAGPGLTYRLLDLHRGATAE